MFPIDVIYPSIIIDNQDPTQKNSMDGLFGKKALIAGQMVKLVNKHEFRKTAYVALNLTYAVSPDPANPDKRAYVTVMITDKTLPSDVQTDVDSIVEFEVELAPRQTFARSYYILSPSECLYVISDSDGVVARADGHDRRIT